jgi:hypothetical protein
LVKVANAVYPTMPPVTSLLRCLAISLVAVALLAACGEKKQGNAAPRPALTVTVAQPEASDLTKRHFCVCCPKGFVIVG